MSAMVKLVTGTCEFHIGQPTAVCQLPVTWWAPVAGGAKGTEERVLALMLSPASSRDKLWRTMPLSLSHAKTAYMVRSMRLIPRSSVRPAKRVGLLRPRREACCDQERWQSGERRSEAQWRAWWRKNTTPNGTWVAFGVRSVVASLGDEPWCGDGSTPQDKDFNDCVHVCLNGDTLPAWKHLAMRLGTFAMLTRWISMRFGSRNYSISMQRRLNSTSMDPTIACTPVRSDVANWHDVSMMKLAMSSWTSAKELSYELFGPSHSFLKRTSDMPMRGLSCWGMSPLVCWHRHQTLGWRVRSFFFLLLSPFFSHPESCLEIKFFFFKKKKRCFSGVEEGR